MRRPSWLLVALLAVSACDARTEADTQISPEPIPSHQVAPQPPKPTLAFALVHEKTDLHAGPNASTTSFRAKARAPGGRTSGGAVLFAIDGEQPESAAWVRLVATDRVGRCGYEPLAVDAPVFVKRADLMRTVVEATTIEGPGRTRIVLQPGVALQPSGDGADELTVTTQETRIKLTFAPTALATDLGEEALVPLEAPAPAAPSASSPAGAKSASLKAAAAHGMVGLLNGPGVEALKVGPHRVRLSTFHPPILGPVEGESDELAHLESPCVDVVGVEVRRPDPFASSLIGRGFSGSALESLGDLAMEVAPSNPGIGLGSIGTMGRGGGGDYGGGSGHGLGRIHGLGARGASPSRGKLSSSRGRLSIGSTHTTRGLSDGVVARMMRSRQSRLTRCYQRGLERDASLRGRVLLSFTVQLDGRVGSARSVPESVSQPNGTDLPDPSVVSCIVQALQGVTFPKPSGEHPVKAKVQLTFRP